MDAPPSIQTSTTGIDVSELRDTYWDGRLDPPSRDIDTTDPQSIRQVVEPVVELVFREVTAQAKEDEKADTQHGQREVFKAVVEAAVENGLEPSDVETAVQKARRHLSERDETWEFVDVSITEYSKMEPGER
jgi:hypothetical protein